jgi:CHAT domain-containing protein/tetratricopeptide (TPR) repeat protein
LPFAVLLSLALCGPLVADPQPAQPSPAPSRQAELVRGALSLLDAGKSEAARAPFEEARALAHSVGDVAVEAAATRGLGILLSAAKDYAGARARFDEALALYESIHDLRGMAQTHSSMGRLAWATANWADVRRFYTAAADEFGGAGDQGERAQQLRNTTFDQTMSDAERAERLAQAWELTRSLGDPRREGLILHVWGDVLTMQGEYGAAFEKLEAAAALLDRSGSPLEISFVATSLGRAYRLNGLPEKALTYYEKALAISEKSGDPRATAQALGAVAAANDALGRRAEALDFAARSLESARASGNRPMVISAVASLSSMQLAVGRYADALALVAPVLREPDEAMKRMEVYLRISLAGAYAGLGQLEEAAREADQAVALGEADDRPTSLLPALERRSRVRLARQDGPGASADAQRALALVERMRAKLPPRDFLKQGFGEMGQQMFTLAIEVGVGLGDAPGTLVAAEQARSRAFQDLLATRELVGRAVAGVAPAGALASDASASAPSLDEMRAVVARLHAPMLAYWVAPHETFAWIVTATGDVSVRRIPVEAVRLEALARAAAVGPDTEGASASAASPKKSGNQPLPIRNRELRELYGLLIRPVRDTLERQGARRLVIIPHGPLFRVSFAALVDERGRYLIEDYELHYAPAAGVLRFTGKNRRAGPIRTTLFVADPDPPSRVGPPSHDRAALPRLPGARREVAEASRLMGAPAEVLVGPQATEARVRSLIAGRDLLHFATHAIVADNDPLASYLALSSSGTESASDGRLTAAEIYGLDIAADLVVLSACRSGAGKVTGDGIIGLTRGLFYAGTPSVLATLWDLADEPAQFIMRRFYTHWKGGGDKAGALRAAQLDLIRALRAGTITVQTPFGQTKLAESPALWASFVLLGEP